MNHPEGGSSLINWKGHAFVALPFRIFLGIVFLAACAYKIANPHDFALSIATYEILPTSLINPMAIVLPWVELAAGLMLVTGFRARAASLLVSGMMAMFLAALSIALSKGLDMSCGCFASAQTGESINALTLLRDSGLLLMSLYVLVFDRRPLGADRLLEKGSKP